MQITIIGAGAFGTALAKILEKNGHKIIFFDPKKFPEIPLASALKNSETIVFSAPSNTAEKTIESLPESAKSLPFILASKGFLSDDIFKSLSHFSILSGPSFADDLNKCLPTTLTITSKTIYSLFKNSWLSFELTKDQKGVLLCGSLKNIYAIFAGMRNIHPATSDFRDFLLSAFREMQSILKANDCNPETANLACGFKDLALTSAMSRSRNYLYGQTLTEKNTQGSAPKISEKTATIEGLSALKSFKNSGLILPENAKIFKTVLSATNLL